MMPESDPPSFRILPGLPGIGPWPRQFSATGMGMHSEGFVVEFASGGTDSWIGNFQPGSGGHCAVFSSAGGSKHVVIAGGQGYVVDPVSGRLDAVFGGAIDGAYEIPESDSLLFSNGIRFFLWRSGELLWSSRRLSWDGLRGVRLEGGKAIGEGWCFDDTWHRFELDLATGKAEGGGYTGPDD